MIFRRPAISHTFIMLSCLYSKYLFLLNIRWGLLFCIHIWLYNSYFAWYILKWDTFLCKFIIVHTMTVCVQLGPRWCGVFDTNKQPTDKRRALALLEKTVCCLIPCDWRGRIIPNWRFCSVMSKSLPVLRSGTREIIARVWHDGVTDPLDPLWNGSELKLHWLHETLVWPGGPHWCSASEGISVPSGSRASNPPKSGYFTFPGARSPWLVVMCQMTQVRLLFTWPGTIPLTQIWSEVSGLPVCWLLRALPLSRRRHDLLWIRLHWMLLWLCCQAW